jgi:hypothetical protein|tara:strand:- start:234 stop:386 length:153 start_codon:yes stop_codon:yes gene_type:complete
MPSKEAKQRKRLRLAKNKELSKKGRTAKQYKRWLAKEREKGPQTPVYGRR